MTTPFGTEMRELATEFLDEFGIPASVTIRSGTATLADDGSSIPTTEATHAVVSTPLLNAEEVIKPAALQHLAGTRGRVVLLAAEGLEFTPQGGMSITVSGQTFSVRAATSYDGDERPAAWLLELEG